MNHTTDSIIRGTRHPGNMYAKEKLVGYAYKLIATDFVRKRSILAGVDVVEGLYVAKGLTYGLKSVPAPRVD